MYDFLDAMITQQTSPEEVCIKPMVLIQCGATYCAVPENIYTHPEEGHWKFLGGGGRVSKAKIFKRRCETKLEFPEGGGVGGLKQKKKPSVGWVFSGTTHYRATTKWF